MLVAFVNGVALFAIATWIVVEAAQRLYEPVEAVRAPPIGRPADEPETNPGERKAREVREHVARVGEQRQRSGQEPAGDLGHHEPAGQKRRNAYAALVAGMGVAMTVAIVTVGVTGRVSALVIVMAVTVRVGVLHR